jgi:DNA-directed RNA polymerase subunit RPC12/RpoP
MACSTCSHTMQLLTIGREATFYHCPRCGTIRRVAGDSTEDTVPKLVHRCQDFQIQMAVGTGLGSQYASKPLVGLWQRLGVAESINVPEARPPAA